MKYFYVQHIFWCQDGIVVSASCMQIRRSPVGFHSQALSLKKKKKASGAFLEKKRQ